MDAPWASSISAPPPVMTQTTASDPSSQPAAPVPMAAVAVAPPDGGTAPPIEPVRTGAAAPGQPETAPAEGSSAARQWVTGNIASQGGSPACMPAEYVYALIQDPSFQPGPRPVHIASLPASASGWVFKESSSGQGESAQRRGNARRAIHRGGQRPDYWHITGGKRNQKNLPREGPTLVRRRNGSVDQRHVVPVVGTEAPAPTPPCAFCYHEYSLLDHSQSPPSVDRRVILYHVLPKKQTKEARVCRPPPPRKAVAPANKAGSLPSGQRGGVGARRLTWAPGGVIEVPMVELGTRLAVGAGEPALSLRAPPTVADGGGGGGGGGGSGSLFTRFVKGGFELGAIRESGRGVQLLSAGGDVAEWHRVQQQRTTTTADDDDDDDDDDEEEEDYEYGVRGVDSFSEGDVVGLWDGELSRRTEGADMCGVITRKAMVTGSTPPFLIAEGGEGGLRRRGLYDTVAYAGRVPVRVRGPPAVCGDWVVPSGRQDGTAMIASRRGGAAPGGPDALGTVIAGDREGGGEHGTLDTVRYLEISVSAPGGGSHGWRPRAPHTAAAVAVVLALLSLCLCSAVLLHQQRSHTPGDPVQSQSVRNQQHWDRATLTEINCTTEAVSAVTHLCNGSTVGCLPGCGRWMKQLLSQCALNLSVWGALQPSIGLPGAQAVDADQEWWFPMNVSQWSPGSGCSEQQQQRHAWRSLEASAAAAAAPQPPPCAPLRPLRDGILGLGAGRSIGVALFDVAQMRRNHSELLELELRMPKLSYVLLNAPKGSAIRPPTAMPHYTSGDDALTVHGSMLVPGEVRTCQPANELIELTD
jgi:hypothetical protein